MRNLRKLLCIGLAATGLGVVAVTAHADRAECDRGMHGGHFDQAKFAEHMQKKMAELHDKLKLSANQEPAWKKFTDSMKPATPPSPPDWQAMSKLPAPERMEQMLKRMKEHETRMSEHLPALKAFYDTLSAAQQKIFDEQFARHERRGRHMGPGAMMAPE